jgi:hypothetical protein
VTAFWQSRQSRDGNRRLPLAWAKFINTMVVRMPIYAHAIQARETRKTTVTCYLPLTAPNQQPVGYIVRKSQGGSRPDVRIANLSLPNLA